MLTKIEAVNIILNVIGETPVSSLASGLPDDEAAELKLDQTVKEVLDKGWQQNSELGITLGRNSDNEIMVPDQYLRVDTVGDDKDVNVTVRKQDGKRKLFDIGKYVYTFDRDLKVDVLISLDFDALNFELQNYIAFRAARKFQESAMGSTLLDSFAARQEQE